MKWLAPDLLSKMSNWIDRSVDPSLDTVEFDGFASIIEGLSTFLWSNDEGEIHSLDEVTESQRRAWCLISYVNAIPFDGLSVGVLVNQPEIMKPIELAASEMKSKPVLDLLVKIRKKLPSNFENMTDHDERMRWLEENEKKADALEELGESDLGEAARSDMGRLAVIIALDHPDEFFKAA